MQPSISRIWSEAEYYADITARPPACDAPLASEAEAAMNKACAGLAAIFANAPPGKPGRSGLSPGMIEHQLVRKRDGELAFMPSVGWITVSKAARSVFGG
jgi:hypothetical protein